jgi:hypothetical protein
VFKGADLIRTKRSESFGQEKTDKPGKIQATMDGLMIHRKSRVPLHIATTLSP